mmetsp:Transcript_4227/g.18867  ORF Transcript_4227/g.18867 Transcript_4227/m.18867 type:complete len:221 (-) Transcript_4227:571-1233(-)
MRSKPAPMAMIPPVDVPTMRSKHSPTYLCPAAAMMRSNTTMDATPRMPPPSRQSTRTPEPPALAGKDLSRKGLPRSPRAYTMRMAVDQRLAFAISSGSTTIGGSTSGSGSGSGLGVRSLGCMYSRWYASQSNPPGLGSYRRNPPSPNPESRRSEAMGLRDPRLFPMDAGRAGRSETGTRPELTTRAASGGPGAGSSFSWSSSSSPPPGSRPSSPRRPRPT